MRLPFASGLRIGPRAGQVSALAASISFDPYNQENFDTILKAWLLAAFAVNSINRSVGMDDANPFLFSLEVTGKLKAVHHVVRSHGRDDQTLAQRLMHVITF